jgi:signal transduction histidine kinase
VWDLRALGRTGGEELFYVDARTVLEIALRLSGPEVARTASVVLELDEVPCVLASESRLCQVFINLLVNAAQAMEARASEGRQIRVKTRHDEDANLVGIDVADNGEGIAADRIARILDLPRHRRAHGRSHRRREHCRDRHHLHRMAIDRARNGGQREREPECHPRSFVVS